VFAESGIVAVAPGRRCAALVVVRMIQVIIAAIVGPNAPRALVRFIAALVVMVCAAAGGWVQGSGDAPSRAETRATGTWSGSSFCVGERPGCKNEMVVYRLLAVANKPRMANLLADKVIDGKRVPMYALEFTLDEEGGTLRCEFTRGQTHGIWEYAMTGDVMTGTLVILPDRSLGRRVSVHRVREDEVPAAPALEEYGM
jgi:hypothetical protein